MISRRKSSLLFVAHRAAGLQHRPQFLAHFLGFELQRRQHELVSLLGDWEPVPRVKVCLLAEVGWDGETPILVKVNVDGWFHEKPRFA
jgi:hypothetical protein